MVTAGAKGFFPSSREDATKLASIIPLSNPHTRTTGFQGTRMYMAEPPGTKSGSLLPVLYCELPRHLFVKHPGRERVLRQKFRAFLGCALGARKWEVASIPSLAAASRRNTNPERGGEINVSSQDHNLIFEFSRGIRAEEFSATRIEQRYLVRLLNHCESVPPTG